MSKSKRKQSKSKSRESLERESISINNEFDVVRTENDRSHKDINDDQGSIVQELRKISQLLERVTCRMDTLEGKITQDKPEGGVANVNREEFLKLEQRVQKLELSDTMYTTNMIKNDIIDENREMSEIKVTELSVDSGEASSDVKGDPVLVRLCNVLEKQQKMQERWCDENWTNGNRQTKVKRWGDHLDDNDRQNTSESVSVFPNQMIGDSHKGGSTMLVTCEDLALLLRSCEELSPPRFLQRLESLLRKFMLSQTSWLDVIFDEAQGVLRAWLIRVRHRVRDWNDFKQQYLHDFYGVQYREHLYNKLWQNWTWAKFKEVNPSGSLVRYLWSITEQLYDIGYHPDTEKDIVKKIIKNLSPAYKQILLVDDNIQGLDDLQRKLKTFDDQFSNDNGGNGRSEMREGEIRRGADRVRHGNRDGNQEFDGRRDIRWRNFNDSSRRGR